ncbi:MAG: hypothetical protein KQH63_17855 [Desulfobulbaceae bacterium]|nr:hypothetical protein [Desulfobulbaceae bacterium]
MNIGGANREKWWAAPLLNRVLKMKIPPEKLYKYLPSEFLDNVLNKGELLFRNLTYFRQSECRQRGDFLEAHHRDNPDNDITLTIKDTGKQVVGDFSFLNTTDSDHIYVFCLSKSFKKDLCKEFKSDSCIEITNVPEFIRRVRIKLKKLLSVHNNGLLHGSAHYYAQNAPAQFNIKDPKELAFAKDEYFQNQEEYRLIFGNRKAFRLVQKIVINSKYDFRKEAMQGAPKEKIIVIGNLSDIARIIT